MIPLASPDIREEDIARVVDVLRSGNLVQGAEVLALESSVAGYLGAGHLLAASNGTATLHLALVALGISPGDEVIIPALSYIATANVVELVGATPVFVDVEERTFNIDVSRIEAAITQRTKAIMPVHEFGLPCEIRKIVTLAEKHGLFVIEDAACALGGKDGDQYAGTFGHFGSFSLHPRKAITSGEGGLLVCANEELAGKIAILRNHGVSIEDGRMVFKEAGFNYRLTEMQAALVHSQFHRLSATLTRKQELAAIYMQEISSLALRLPLVPADKTHTWQTFHVLVDPAIDRDRLIADLRTAGIGTNYGAQCMPAQDFYQRKYGLDSATLFPNALAAFSHGLALPLYEKLTDAQIRTISTTIQDLISKS